MTGQAGNTASPGRVGDATADLELFQRILVLETHLTKDRLMDGDMAYLDSIAVLKEAIESLRLPESSLRHAGHERPIIGISKNSDSWLTTISAYPRHDHTSMLLRNLAVSLNELDIHVVSLSLHEELLEELRLLDNMHVSDESSAAASLLARGALLATLVMGERQLPENLARSIIRWSRELHTALDERVVRAPPFSHYPQPSRAGTETSRIPAQKHGQTLC